MNGRVKLSRRRLVLKDLRRREGVVSRMSVRLRRVRRRRSEVRRLAMALLSRSLLLGWRLGRRLDVLFDHLLMCAEHGQRKTL